MMWIVWLILGLAAAALLALLAIGLVMYGVAVPRKAWIQAAAHNPTPEEKAAWEDNKAQAEARKAAMLALPAEIWKMTSRDGLELYARFIPAENARGVILCAHGYRSQPAWDFAISVPFFQEQGYSLLLIDQRGHGDSQGNFVCFGTMERFDIADWCVRLTEKTTLPIWLYGISMGCASVLFTLGQPLPAAVKGVIADCGYTAPRDVFIHLMKDTFHVPGELVAPFSGLWIRLLAGWDDRLSTLPILEKNTLPILFICGTADNFVPTRMTRANYDACRAPKELLLAEGAGHALSYGYIPKEYQAAVLRLLAGETGKEPK